MIENCYVDAGSDEIKSQACDMIESDILQALWSGLPFHRILSVNGNKYMHVESDMDAALYLKLNDIFENFGIEFFELLEEIDSHKDITLLKLKEFVEER